MKTGRDVRLPTEAEWEYACRAGTTSTYSFGDDGKLLAEYAWHDANAYKSDEQYAHGVGQKKPNPWGLYDIYGNVFERVADTYARDYYAKSPNQDPTGPGQGEKSRLDYAFDVPSPGTYALTVQVVANNYNQTLDVSANGEGPEVSMKLPFTFGQWKESEPVMLTLKQGGNTLHFARTNPPQAGIAVKSFTLKPVK